MGRIDTQTAKGFVARRLAPEDIRTGGYVAILHVITEHVPMFFDLESQAAGRFEPIRVRQMPHGCEPMEVLEVCLPFVLVKQVDGDPLTLDVRRCALAGVSPRFGREAFERHKAAKKTRKDEETKNDDD